MTFAATLVIVVLLALWGISQSAIKTYNAPYVSPPQPSQAPWPAMTKQERNQLYGTPEPNYPPPSIDLKSKPAICYSPFEPIAKTLQAQVKEYRKYLLDRAKAGC